MPCYKLIVAYDGTRYNGWQIQPNGISIQQHIEDALSIISKNEKIRVIGSGRTDAGVHAKGQTAHFKTLQEIDLSKLLYSLNGILPQDIRIRAAEKVLDNFHSQYSAIGKEYHYHLHIHSVIDPFNRLYKWHFPHPLNLHLIEKGTKLFIGTHDFTSFANEGHAGAAAKNPVRTLYRLDCIHTEEDMRFEFEGNGFLYKMVRNIVGTLIELGKQKITLDHIEKIFAAKDRRFAAQAAPPQGLFLIKVNYPTQL